MRRILFLLLILGLFSGCGGSGASARTTLVIDGMTCTGCESHVREALESLSGVEVVSVSRGDGTAVILDSGKHTEAEYRKVIAATGKNLKKVRSETPTP